MHKKTNRKDNFTKFIFASIDDKERHSFKVKLQTHEMHEDLDILRSHCESRLRHKEISRKNTFWTFLIAKTWERKIWIFCAEP